jgi:hypothetical protein
MSRGRFIPDMLAIISSIVKENVMALMIAPSLVGWLEQKLDFR